MVPSRVREIVQEMDHSVTEFVRILTITADLPCVTRYQERNSKL